MEEAVRGPFRGIINIIRFNRQYYLLAGGLIVLSLLLIYFLPGQVSEIFILMIAVAVTGMILSIIASWYIYDHSNLYKLDWLDELKIKEGSVLVNINAGFDETSNLIKNKFPECGLAVFDFYNPKKHTEISIERARRVNKPFPGTKVIDTQSVPLKFGSVDYIFLILCAHEIRNENEQIQFFNQLKESLSISGRIVVVEHSRDLVNFIAYNFGIMHFFSKQHWKRVYNSAGFRIELEKNITPFITNYILSKNGNAS